MQQLSTSELIAKLNYSQFKRRLSDIFLKRVKVGGGVLGFDMRPLNAEEIALLERKGNVCADWSLVSVAKDFVADHISQSQFIGHCVLGVFDGSLVQIGGGGGLPSGIWFSTIQDSEIGSGSVIHRCARISDTVVKNDCVLSNSSTSYGLQNAYGNGQWIKVGVETGGRETPIFADLSLELAEHILSNPASESVKSIVSDFVKSYSDSVKRPFTFIDEHCSVLDCRTIRESYLGPYSHVANAELISGSTIVSTAEDPVRIGAAVIVRDSILQEGTSVDDGAILERSMMFEHSHATQHGKVVDSLVGPNSGVSKGEATASYLGPFVGFHHQSLLIAAFWPRGRGNIGYGANVGSNHTSRAPDQEFWPGEGMFFGLGSTIKYPANFREAPYTIIAAGVTTLPMRMSFPFSLINEPVAYYLEVPPGYNNLIPAWGLSDNFYALKRNEGKYIARNKAKRNLFDLNMFRPEILEYMRNAMQILKSVKERKTIYLPGDIPQIGKNMLTEENRLKAIDSYQFFLDLAAYRTVFAEIDGLIEKDAGKNLVRAQGQDTLDSLVKLHDMLPSLVRRTEVSRTRDFDRGSAIIDDYADTHASVDSDPFVQQVREEIAHEIASVERAITVLSEV